MMVRITNKFKDCETCKFNYNYKYLCKICIKTEGKKQLPYFYLNRGTQLHNFCLLCNENDPNQQILLKCRYCYKDYHHNYPTEFVNTLNSRYNDEYFMHRVLYFLEDLYSIELSKLLKLMGVGKYYLNECIKTLEIEGALIVNNINIKIGPKFKEVFSAMKIRKKLMQKIIEMQLMPITEVKL